MKKFSMENKQVFQEKGASVRCKISINMFSESLKPGSRIFWTKPAFSEVSCSCRNKKRGQKDTIFKNASDLGKKMILQICQRHANRHISKALIDLSGCIKGDNAHLQVLHGYFIHSRIAIILHAFWLYLEVKEHQALFLAFT